MRTRWTVPLVTLVVLLLSIGSFTTALAQNATPGATPEGTPAASPVAGTPAATPQTTSVEPLRSITRAEYYQQLREEFQFEEPASEGGQLIQAEISDISTTNPLLIGDIYSGWIAGLTFDTLVDVSPIDGSIVPRLADSYERASDGVTHTFNLNPDARWHDGTDLTAADVVFSFDYVNSEEGISNYKSDFQAEVASYRAIDDDTVEIVTKAPIATFLYDVAGTVWVMPRHIWQDVPFADWQNDPGSTGEDPARVVGTGPFRFQEWVQNDHVTVVRNDEYWDPESMPVIDEYIFRVLPDEATIIQALTTGEVDVYENVSPAQVEEVQNSEGAEVANTESLGFNWYAPNHELPHFQQVEVRQALLYGLDRDLIAEEIYLGFAEPANGTQPTLSPSYAPDQIETVYNYDPDRARQLLEQAGYTDSDGNDVVDKDINDDGTVAEDEQLSFEFLYTENVAIYEQMVPYMQEAWAEIGVEMVPQAVPFPTLSDRVDTGDFGIALYGFTWGPDGGQGLMFRCDAFAPNGFNSMRYCNPEYDALDDRMDQTLDDEERYGLQIELSNIVNNDAANGVLVFRERNRGYSTRVHNFFPTGFAFIWTVPFVWVDPQ